VNAIFEFYSTRSIIFFQEKISVERVESSKMSTLVPTTMRLGSNKDSQFHTCLNNIIRIKRLSGTELQRAEQGEPGECIFFHIDQAY
jgi:hypothetical protein